MTTSSFLSVFAAKEAQRFKMKVGVFLMLIEGGKILLLRRARTGIEDGMYVLPMGGHDGREPLTQTLIREAREETGLVLQPNDIEVCHVVHRFHFMPEGLSFEQMDVYFRAEKYSGVPQNLEPDRCDEVAFYPLNQLPNPISPFIRAALDNVEQGKFFSEFGWEKS